MSPVTPRLFAGSVWHTRLQPEKHSFSYPLMYIGLPINFKQVTRLPWPVLSSSKWSLFSVDTARQLHYSNTERAPAQFEDRVLDACKASGIETTADRIYWLTLPALFGYRFEPVSFFVIFNDHNQPAGLICDVKNTFDESYSYVSKPKARTTDFTTFTFPKEFYVSPFLSKDGQYTVQLKNSSEELNVEILLEQEKKLVFKAGFKGRALPLNSRTLLSQGFWNLFAPWLTSARISIQALILSLGMRLSVFPKQIPQPSSHTRIQPSFWSRFRYRVLGIMEKLPARKFNLKE